MDATNIVVALLSAGGATIIAAFVNAFFNRRKLSAEATEIITKAAAGTVENVVADNARLRLEVNELRVQLAQLAETVAISEKRERAHEMSQERWIWHMGRWHRHGSRLAEELRAAGITPEEAPPLWPKPVEPGDIHQ